MEFIVKKQQGKPFTWRYKEQKTETSAGRGWGKGLSLLSMNLDMLPKVLIHAHVLL